MASLNRSFLNKWTSELEIRAKNVLDIGGLGLPIEGRPKVWEVENYKILDSEETKHGRIADYRNDLNYPFHLDEKFDVAFCIEVMQFVYNPMAAIRSMADLLEPGGTLYINFHFSMGRMKNGHDYLRYTEYGAETLLKKNGFTIKRRTDTLFGCLVEAIHGK